MLDITLGVLAIILVILFIFWCIGSFIDRLIWRGDRDE